MKTNNDFSFNRIKRLAMIFTVSATLFCAFPALSYAGSKTTADVELNHRVSTKAEGDIMLSRLEEIKTMDHSKLSPPERKTLRKELLAIKKKFQTLDGGIYISAGAIIIILLLIIILF